MKKEVKNKIDFMNDVIATLGFKLGSKSYNDAMGIYKKYYRRWMKDKTDLLIGLRLIYCIQFSIIFLYAAFGIKEVFFSAIVGFIAVYNFLAFLTQYVFYRNNFRVNDKDGSGSQDRVE